MVKEAKLATLPYSLKVFPIKNPAKIFRFQSEIWLMLLADGTGLAKEGFCFGLVIKPERSIIAMRKKYLTIWSFWLYFISIMFRKLKRTGKAFYKLFPKSGYEPVFLAVQPDSGYPNLFAYNQVRRNAQSEKDLSMFTRQCTLIEHLWYW